MPATTATLRIGDVARLAETTPRTIRYYEEKGLLAPAEERQAGRHRLYTDADVERVRQVLRLRDLLGVSLDELREIVAAEDERALLRDELQRTESPERRAQLLNAALAVADRQLALVDRRAGELDRLRAELLERRERILGALDVSPRA